MKKDKKLFKMEGVSITVYNFTYGMPTLWVQSILSFKLQVVF